ncbi:MAG: hypothetical protein IJV06_05510 [Bacteroidaceae bacterium]|nr:hypothetical protein [Bacteroidaceae bacterium]
MFYNFQRKKLCSHLLAGGAMLAAGLGVLSCSDKYDLDSDSNQPSNLNDIYDYLVEEGTYTNYVQLIRDLGEAEVLSKTGSKTLFVADDDAFAKFFASNSWNVSSYDQLTTAQKKLLLYSSMIDNPYSTSMLATADGPVKGEVFRRASSTTIYDSVLVVPASDPEGILPDNDRFNELKANHPNIVLFDEARQPAPMLHFTSKFMSANKVFTTDIDFLYSKWLGKDNRAEEDVYVNNAKILEANVFCKNGFVQKVDEVVVPLDNMAEALRKCSKTQLFSSILERFAAPAYQQSLTEAYNQNKGTEYDSVFIKRYFSKRSYGSGLGDKDVAFDTDKNGNPFNGQLKFDPGWNGYYPDITPKGSDPMMEEMGVMLVPTDAALEAWWNGEGGDDIRKFYAQSGDDTKTGLRKTPTSVLDELINAGQYASFCQTIPSNFSNVLDGAQMELGITENDIDSVIMCCNGAIYLTNKVFAPVAYSSVLSPSVIDTMSYNTISNAIENMEYGAYLNSMVSRYTFLLPTSAALLNYVDPVSYGLAQPQMWALRYDASKTQTRCIVVDVYNCTIDENGVPTPVGDKLRTIEETLSSSLDGSLKDRMEDILDNLIITQDYTAGKQYYKTKGNTFVRIVPSGTDYHVFGSWQQQYENPIVVDKDSIYTKRNGSTFVVDRVPMGASKSVAQTLADHPEFSDFLWVLQNSGALSTTNAKDGWQAGDQKIGNLFNVKDGGSIGAEDTDSKSRKATYLLNNFHYTVYAPTNDAMKLAFAAGLPDSTALRLAEEYDQSVAEDVDAAADSAAKVQEVLLDFVKYHIQDNSIFMDQGFESNSYESGKTELTPSTNIVEAGAETTIAVVDNTHIRVMTTSNPDGTVYETPDQTANSNVLTKSADGTITAAQYYTGKYSPGRPYKLNVNVSASSMTVTDVEGNTRNVSTVEGLHNLMAREYWYKSSSSVTPANAYNTKLDNSSFVVIQGIDGPLFFDTPSQFKYTRKQLTTEAKRRR